MIFKLSLPSVGEKTLGKELFAECCICDTRQRALCQVSKKDTRQRNSLPSVKNKTLGKELFAKCQKKTLGKETLCRVSKIKHLAKSFFAECFLLPRVFVWHSAKSSLPSVRNKTLGKEFGTRQRAKFR
jgi:hypothetical protein